MHNTIKDLNLVLNHDQSYFNIKMTEYIIIWTPVQMVPYTYLNQVLQKKKKPKQNIKKKKKKKKK